MPSTDLMDGLDSLIAKARSDLGILEEAKSRLRGEAKAKPATPAAKPPRKRAKAAPKARRKRAGGTRADKTLKLIEESPGITGKQLAEAMKMKPNYLYRVLGDLEQEGKVTKEGRQYEAVPA